MAPFPSRWIALGLGLAALTASPASAQNSTVVARVVEPAGGWTACGLLFVRGEALFETVEVRSGTFSPGRFVGVYDCPGGRSIQGTLELTLVSPIPRRGVVAGPRPDASLPRYFVETEKIVFAANIAPMLGKRRAWIRQQYPHARQDGEWTHFEDRLSVRFAAGRAVEIRATIPGALTTCAEIATWSGYADAGPALRRRHSCQWPGISERHRLGPGIVGRTEGSVFVLTAR